MSSRRRKDELRALADAAERSEALTVERDVEVDVHYREAGTPLLQLALVPSFFPSTVWEIRDVGTLVAYRSRGTEIGSRMVKGHARVPVPASLLAATLERLRGARVAALIAVPTFGVADGETYIATLHGGWAMTLRLTWCSGCHPEEWTPVVEELLRFQALFDGLDDE